MILLLSVSVKALQLAYLIPGAFCHLSYQCCCASFHKYQGPLKYGSPRIWNGLCYDEVGENDDEDVVILEASTSSAVVVRRCQIGLQSTTERRG